MARITSMAAGLALAALSGCASMTESTLQTLELHTIENHREIAGVGCVLSNQAGRWFVRSPGRVSVQRSAGALSIDCRKDGAAIGYDSVASRFGTASLVGNVVLSAGLGYLVDRRTGAGFDYPATLIVIMRPSAAAPEAEPLASFDNRLY